MRATQAVTTPSAGEWPEYVPSWCHEKKAGEEGGLMLRSEDQQRRSSVPRASRAAATSLGANTMSRAHLVGTVRHDPCRL